MCVALDRESDGPSAMGRQEVSGTSDVQARVDAAKTTAADAKASLADTAQNLSSKAGAAASEVADQAKSKASAAVGSVRDQATETLEQQKAGIADQLQDLAQAAHKSGEQLEGHQDFVAQLIERGADQLGSFANTLRNNDLNGLLSSLQSLARSQPALFAGGAVAAGFALARVGKIAVAGASRDDLPKLPTSSVTPIATGAGAPSAPASENVVTTPGAPFPIVQDNAQ